MALRAGRATPAAAVEDLAAALAGASEPPVGGHCPGRLLAYALVLLGLLIHLPMVIALLALAPMVLLPLLGYLTYWLLWKEFHEWTGQQPQPSPGFSS